MRRSRVREIKSRFDSIRPPCSPSSAPRCRSRCGAKPAAPCAASIRHATRSKMLSLPSVPPAVTRASSRTSAHACGAAEVGRRPQRFGVARERSCRRRGRAARDGPKERSTDVVRVSDAGRLPKLPSDSSLMHRALTTTLFQPRRTRSRASEASLQPRASRRRRRAARRRRRSSSRTHRPRPSRPAATTTTRRRRARPRRSESNRRCPSVRAARRRARPPTRAVPREMRHRG